MNETNRQKLGIDKWINELMNNEKITCMNELTNRTYEWKKGELIINICGELGGAESRGNGVRPVE